MRLTQQQKDANKAARINRKRAEAAPLFAYAGILEQETADTVAAKRAADRRWAAEHFDQMEAFAVTQAAAAEEMRQEFNRRVSPEIQAAAADRYSRASFPKTPHFVADYWYQRLKDNGIDYTPEYRRGRA